MVRWLREQGLEAGAFTTEYGDDAIEADEAENGQASPSGQQAVEPAPASEAES
jgi:putative mRNA 3-end processing factor